VLDELVHHNLCFFQTGAHRFEAFDERLSHEGRFPVWGHDNG
jgi:hypothetical protein